MRKCKEWIAVMPEYLEGHLDPDAARDLDQHLADCPRCLDSMAEELIMAYREAADHRPLTVFAVIGAGSALR